MTRLTLTAGVLLALGAPAWAANKEMERLAIQMAALQGQMADLQRTTEDSLREIRRLADALGEQNALLKRAVQDRGRQEDAAQSALKDLSERITERLAELDARLQSLSAAAAAASAAGAGPAGSPGSPGDGGSPGAAAEQAPPQGELYRQAYADYTRGSYDLAIQEYQQYLHFYPQTELSDNAQYWIGECLYGKRSYREAIEAWDELARLYPASDKLPDARYKKALALEQLGRRRDAMAELRSVVERYPNSDAGKKARERLGSQ